MAVFKTGYQKVVQFWNYGTDGEIARGQLVQLDGAGQKSIERNVPSLDLTIGVPCIKKNILAHAGNFLGIALDTIASSEMGPVVVEGTVPVMIGSAQGNLSQGTYLYPGSAGKGLVRGVATAIASTSILISSGVIGMVTDADYSTAASAGTDGLVECHIPPRYGTHGADKIAAS